MANVPIGINPQAQQVGFQQPQQQGLQQAAFTPPAPPSIGRSVGGGTATAGAATGELGWPDALRGLAAFIQVQAANRRRRPQAPSVPSFARRGSGRTAGPLAQPGGLGQFIGR